MSYPPQQGDYHPQGGHPPAGSYSHLPPPPPGAYAHLPPPPPPPPQQQWSGYAPPPPPNTHAVPTAFVEPPRLPPVYGAPPPPEDMYAAAMAASASPPHVPGVPYRHGELRGPPPASAPEPPRTGAARPPPPVPTGRPVVYAPPSSAARSPPPLPPVPPPTPRSVTSPSPASPPQTAGTSPAVNTITSQLGGVRLGSSHPPLDVEDPLKPLPRLRESGPPAEVLFDCPQQRTVDYPTWWYHLTSASSATLMCTYCHEQQVARSPLVTAFQKVHRPSGACVFHSTRVAKVLLPTARTNGDPTPLTEFFTKRNKVPNCGEAQTRWYTPSGSGDLFACEACFEDTVAASPWRAMFSLASPPSSPPTCAFSSLFAERSYLKLQRVPRGWEQWLQGARTRAQLPPCDGKGVQYTARKWYTTRQPIHGWVACETCWHDFVAYSRFHGEFVPNSANNGAPGEWVCDMSAIQLKMAYSTVYHHSDFSVWWSAASNILAIDQAAANGSKTPWFGLRTGSDFACCARCHAGIMSPLGLTPFLVQRQVPDGATPMCDMCVGPRFAIMSPRLLEALETGVWAAFAGPAAHYATVPLCPRRSALENAEWWGFPEHDLAVCSDCWMSFGVHTPLAARVTAKGVRRYGATICSLYSPRMRQKWLEAGTSTAPNALAELLAFAKARAAIWARTMPRWDALLALQKQKVAQAAQSATLAVLYNGMNNVVSASSAYGTGYLHGGGSLGWHDTVMGAQAQGFNQDMDAQNAAVAAPGTWGEMAQLEMQWTKVE
ncbi:hypothetical protein Q8F55_004522 [Vanrija albida]|uniref:Integral membrane protein n=1 Tax=Vanrija albida TaxID=181172 RepID=A0ABR3Q703_9TREE